MGVIERITDRCVVLNFGRKIAEGPYREVAADRQVQEAYLGVAMMTAELREIEGVCTAYDKADVLEGVSLTVAPGKHHLSAGLERLRQDHADPLDPRADAAARGPHPLSTATTSPHCRPTG